MGTEQLLYKTQYLPDESCFYIEFVVTDSDVRSNVHISI